MTYLRIGAPPSEAGGSKLILILLESASTKRGFCGAVGGAAARNVADDDLGPSPAVLTEVT
jgi:hypothetical protein